LNFNLKRYEERKEDLKKATQRLGEAIKEPDTELAIDGTLHRFEFTFELAWKTMKDYLENQGIISKIGSPREVIKEAFTAGIIEDGEEWLNMMLARNELSHLYDEETSREIYDNIKKKYIFEFIKLLKKLDKIDKM